MPVISLLQELITLALRVLLCEVELRDPEFRHVHPSDGLPRRYTVLLGTYLSSLGRAAGRAYPPTCVAGALRPLFDVL